MAQNVVRALFTLSLFFLWTPRSQAQALSPYRAQVLSQNAGGDFKLQIFGLGLTELHLRPTEVRTFGNVIVQSYRGKAILITRGKRTTRKTKEDVVAVGYVDSKGGKQLDVTFRTSKKMYRVYLGDGTKRGARVERDSPKKEQRCAHGDNHSVTLPFSRSSLAHAASQADELREFREVEVAIDVDYYATLTLGEQLIPRVVALLETANLNFERDLGVHLTLARVHIQDSYSEFPQGVDTISDLFKLFAAKKNTLGSAHIYHLLVGRRVTDLAGYALPLWCSATLSPSLSFSISVFDPVVFAHEIGHMLGAGHTVTPGIMSTVSSAPYFDEETKKQVAYFLSAPQASCIKRVSLLPQPTPTATPTVTPTSTPQPIHTATPTARPPILPPVLQLGLDREGLLSGRVQVQNFSEGCTISILVGSSNTEMRRSRDYAKTALTSLSMKIEGKVTSKLKKLTSKDRRRVYVAALHFCPGMIGSFSRSVVLNPFVLRKGKVTTYTSWMKQLGKSLRATEL